MRRRERFPIERESSLNGFQTLGTLSRRDPEPTTDRTHPHSSPRSPSPPPTYPPELLNAKKPIQASVRPPRHSERLCPTYPLPSFPTASEAPKNPPKPTALPSEPKPGLRGFGLSRTFAVFLVRLPSVPVSETIHNSMRSFWQWLEHAGDDPSAADNVATLIAQAGAVGVSLQCLRKVVRLSPGKPGRGPEGAVGVEACGAADGQRCEGLSGGVTARSCPDCRSVGKATERQDRQDDL